MSMSNKYDGQGYDKKGYDRQENDGHNHKYDGHSHKYGGDKHDDYGSDGMSDGGKGQYDQNHGGSDQSGKGQYGKDHGGNDQISKGQYGKDHGGKQVDVRPGDSCHGEKGAEDFVFHDKGHWTIDNCNWQEGDKLDFTGYGLTREEIASHITNITIEANTFIVNFGNDVSITLIGQPPTWDNVICAEPVR